jgi:hypothetical protein
MKNIDWKHIAITGITVLVALAVYDRWLSPLIAKKLN